MLPHVNNVCKSAFYPLCTIARERKHLSTQTTEILIHAFVTSKLDHCNSLLYNVPKNVIKEASIGAECSCQTDYTPARKCDHITPILLDIHWLLVSERINFKILLLAFKALHQQSPTYIQDLITRHLLACSAGDFFGRTNVLLAKAHVETRNGASQKERGRGRGERRVFFSFWSIFFSPPPPLFPSFALAPTLRVTIFTLPNLPPS